MNQKIKNEIKRGYTADYELSNKYKEKEKMNRNN